MRFISGLFLMLLAMQAWALGCTITTTPIGFGGYRSLSVFPLDATADVNINCDASLLYVIKLDAGGNSGGTFSPRKMLLVGGGGVLNYNLYRDAARNEIWGDGINGSFIQSGTGTSANIPWLVYGRMPSRQNVGAGNYADNVTVTIEW
ncbi:MAG: spore coat protein U domain-containing protein [Sideroxydans sp.]|nr:spore coat protein U domain-containing protein [Sideroxydans sp.]